MTKKVIYHFKSEETRRGRLINALVAFLSAQRYSVIFNIKLTIVRRYYPNDPIKTRVIRDFYTAVVLIPFGLFVLFMAKTCTYEGEAVTPQDDSTILVEDVPPKPSPITK